MGVTPTLNYESNTFIDSLLTILKNKTKILILVGTKFLEASPPRPF